MSFGIVFDIQRLCVHDGPGIRTTVFLKGCSLHCFWCHNPESIHPAPQLMVFPEKCIVCYRCVNACVRNAHGIENDRHIFHRANCNGCGSCAASCEAGALVLSGAAMTTANVMAEILKDCAFYEKSGGGVTFSGGEPLLQIDFLEELLIACKKHNLHTAIETAGNVDFERIARIIPYVDLFLYDLKVMDSALHKQAVGCNNTQCLSNLKRLSALGAKIKVRVPIIPTVNDFSAAIGHIGSFVFGLANDMEVELLPFHKLGLAKYQSLDMEYKAESLTPPNKETMEQFNEILRQAVPEEWR